MAFEPMIFADDVEATSRWYQQLLGLKSAHGGPHFEMLMDAGGALALQLHHADAEEHGGERLPVGSSRGAGVLLYFKTDDVRAIYAKAQAMGARLETEPTFVQLAGHTEFVVRDPDGYAIAVCQRGNV
jgi:catechol 2,3-dioxygenase-like lactoylglutathione lyase family enzyme